MTVEHTDFWVAVATVAPVVALAHIVLVSRYLNAGELVWKRPRQMSEAVTTALQEANASLDVFDVDADALGDLIHDIEVRREASGVLDEGEVAAVRAFHQEHKDRLAAIRARRDATQVTVKVLKKLTRVSRVLTFLAYLFQSVAVCSFLLCGGAVYVALESLARGSDLGTTGWPILWIMLGIGGLWVEAAIDIVLRTAIGADLAVPTALPS
jgi:hypothetical protein